MPKMLLDRTGSVIAVIAIVTVTVDPKFDTVASEVEIMKRRQFS